MALFPTDAKDGQLLEADNGVYYVYNKGKNVWQSNNVIPKWSDQVFIRGGDNQTQQNVNDTNQQVNVKVGNVATATNQLLDVAFDVRCRGVWIYQGGAVAPGDPPVGLQRFLLTDAEGNKTQDYSEAASLTIHAMGAGQLDKISIGETELGDLITIQNSSDLGGGSYIVTGIEEFHNDNPDDLTETYAIYTVTADSRRCNGTVATEEKAVIRIIPQQAVPAFEDEYLPLSGGSITGQLSVAGNFSAQGDVLFPFARDKAFRVYDVQGGQVFSVSGDIFGAGAMYYGAVDQPNHVVTKEYADSTYLGLAGGTANKMQGNLYLGGFGIKGVGAPDVSSDAANKGYVDEQIAAIEIPEIPEVPEGAKAKSGNNTNPTLETGELYLCTANATLYIGI